MGTPKAPRNNHRLQVALNRILEGVTVPPDDLHEIVRYMNHELPRFEQSDVSYLVLGSYRDEYGIRLRKFAHRLNMPTNAESIVLGDTIDLDTTVVPAFDIKLNLLGEAADYIAGVYEKESGGEGPELGVVRSLFADKTWVFPRDYCGLSREQLESRADVVAAAVAVYVSDAAAADRRTELLRLLTVAQENNVDISERELTDILQQRTAELDEPPAVYSWVHLSFFRRFESMGRCHPWFTPTELYTNAAELPGEKRPAWEHDFQPSDFGE